MKKIDEAIKTFSDAQNSVMNDFMEQRWNTLVSSIVDTLKQQEDASQFPSSSSAHEIEMDNNEAGAKSEAFEIEEVSVEQTESVDKTTLLGYDIEKENFVKIT